ncbi:CUZD1-like protein [Mya arenaria]|uniref:CUZD1-like protein n=1 Tax=Mya arenaria TaxID=6604 RepID=A0ABY7E584_MYAAR|nr:CUZD1-like protein [Mya arenaria]
MTFYSDSNFLNTIAGNPLQVTIGTDIYIKVFTPAADWSTEMRLQSCYVKPATNSTAHLTSYLIKDGCEVDVNTHVILVSTHETRVVFRRFQYPQSDAGINVICDAIFCSARDALSRCRLGCKN